MSGFDYAKAKATADRLIAKFGQPAILRRPSATGPKYDPTPGAPTDYPVTVAVVEFSTYERDTAGNRIQASDKKVLLARGNLATDPVPSDKLVLGGVEHRIVGPDVGLGVKALAPAGVVVMYELQVRL